MTSVKKMFALNLYPFTIIEKMNLQVLCYAMQYCFLCKFPYVCKQYRVQILNVPLQYFKFLINEIN